MVYVLFYVLLAGQVLQWSLRYLVKVLLLIKHYKECRVGNKFRHMPVINKYRRDAKLHRRKRLVRKVSNNTPTYAYRNLLIVHYSYESATFYH